MIIRRLNSIRKPNQREATISRVRPVDPINKIVNPGYNGYQDVYCRDSNNMEQDPNLESKEVTIPQQLENDGQEYKIIGSTIMPNGKSITLFKNEKGEIINGQEMAARENSSKGNR